MDKKFAKYLVWNLTLGFVLVTGLYLLMFAAVPWTWAKALVVFGLYWLGGMLVSFLLSWGMHFWKHWSATNIFVYRPFTAFLSMGVLWVGFTFVTGPDPNLLQSFLMFVLSKASIVGVGYVVADLTSFGVSQKITKNFIGVA